MDYSQTHSEESSLNCTTEPPSCLDGLRLSSLHLENFRNYEQFSLEEISPLTIFIGPNAVGKTSAIEAIQMLTALKSFRTNQYSQLQHWGCNRCSSEASIQGNGRHLVMRLTIENGKRSYQLNGKNKRIQDLKGLLPAVSFSPDDLELVKGSNSIRRDAIDGIGSQLSKNFYKVKSDFTKLIKQKNKALKDELPDVFIDSIDELLVRVGTQMMSHRMVIIEKMHTEFLRFYQEISGGREKIDIIYIPSWIQTAHTSSLQSEEELFAFGVNSSSFDRDEMKILFSRALQENRAQERARMKSIIGPHNDKIYFLLNNRNALHYSSQGQQRSIVLAFKLAEASVINEVLHQKPVLLLDDVLSELDEKRRQYFLEFISEDIQTFITTTNTEYFNKKIMAQAEMVHLT